ncbi:transposase [bacterium]|nr:transposase [bacterium]
MDKKIWEQESVEDARRKASELIFVLERVRPDVTEWIEETIDDTFAIYAFPASHRRKLKSTNMLERVNQELKRRTHVVRIFPNVRACLRMCGTLCMEYSEEWSTGKRYLTMENQTKTEIENEPNANLQKI